MGFGFVFHTVTAWLILTCFTLITEWTDIHVSTADTAAVLSTDYSWHHTIDIFRDTTRTVPMFQRSGDTV